MTRNLYLYYFREKEWFIIPTIGVKNELSAVGINLHILNYTFFICYFKKIG